MDQHEAQSGDPLAKKRTYPLKQPVNAGGTILKEVTCREATAADLEDFSLEIGQDGKTSIRIGDAMRVISRCSGIPLPHLGLVKTGDAIAMVGFFGPFCGLGAETGKSG
jgi:hypothetical protein